MLTAPIRCLALWCPSPTLDFSWNHQFTTVWIISVVCRKKKKKEEKKSFIIINAVRRIVTIWKKKNVKTHLATTFNLMSLGKRWASRKKLSSSPMFLHVVEWFRAHRLEILFWNALFRLRSLRKRSFCLVFGAAYHEEAQKKKRGGSPFVHLYRIGPRYGTMTLFVKLM